MRQLSSRRGNIMRMWCELADARTRTVTFSVLLSVVCSLVSCEQDPMARAQRQFNNAERHAKEGKTATAIIEYRRALQSNPKLIAAHFQLGKLYLDSQDYSNAFQQLSTVVKLDPSSNAARLMLADLLVKSAKYEEAKEQAGAVLGQLPNDPGALLISAQSLAGLNEKTDARSVLERLLKLDPNNSRAWFLLAGLQFQEKEYQNGE